MSSSSSMNLNVKGNDPELPTENSTPDTSLSKKEINLDSETGNYSNEIDNEKNYSSDSNNKKQIDQDNQEDHQYKHDEQYRLGGRPPFQTLCHLIVGPLLSQISQSLYGIMDSFWISKSIGKKGMTVMSIILVIDFINIAFAQYFNVAVSARISYLFGKHLK